MQKWRNCTNVSDFWVILQKNLNLKNNYKRLEDEFNKAQKRIQSLSNGQIDEPLDNVENGVKSISPKFSSLFSCDQCTKNFLTADSLKSHQQRKHSVFQEKHELSDENEKETSTKWPAPNEANDENRSNDVVIVSDAPEIATEIDDAKAIDGGNVVANSIVAGEPLEVSTEQNGHQSPESITTANAEENNDHVESTECAVCVRRATATSSNIGVQCDDLVIHENHKNINNAQMPSNMPQLESDLIQTAYVTINELKNDILELRNALEYQAIDAANPEQSAKQLNRDEHKLDETNEKIDVIEQKFTAFESKFMQSEHQFIESFRNLDEQQKSYMSNIQATIKEIVVQSLTGQQDNVEGESVEIAPTANKEDQEPMEKSQEFVANRSEVAVQTVQPKPEVKPRTVLQQQYICSTSESDSEMDEVVCHVDVHAVDSDRSDASAKIGQSHRNRFDEDGENGEAAYHVDEHTTDSDRSDASQMGGNTQRNGVDEDEDGSQMDEVRHDVINELEQRLRQIGVDVDSTGLSTPRSEKAQQNLTDDREEMVKVSRRVQNFVNFDFIDFFSWLFWLDLFVGTLYFPIFWGGFSPFFVIFFVFHFNFSRIHHFSIHHQLFNIPVQQSIQSNPNKVK